jgi:hypothetical protein
MSGRATGILRWLRQPINLLWVLASLLVAFAFYGRWQASQPAAAPPSDVIILSAAEVEQLGGGARPRWSQLRDAYGLSDAQMERSACLTKEVAECDRDLTGEGEDSANPEKGRLIISLSDR